MDAFEKFKQDVVLGRIDLGHLVNEVAGLYGQLHAFQDLKEKLQADQQRLQTANEQFQAEIAELKKQVAELKKQIPGATTAATSPKVAVPFSMRAEEKRQRARGRGGRKESKKQRRGRIATEEKIRRAEAIEDIYPEGVPPEKCRLSHVRVVWRLIDLKPKLIAYRIFRGPNKKYGVIPGVLGRSEFDQEIVVTLAYLVHVMGLSFDKACAVMGFLLNLNLAKSQADALLRQLARHWRQEFEILCTLLANSLVVHADETSWSIKSVWALLSEKARVLLYGVRKDAATLKELLNPETFAGLVVSDDAAIYANFTKAQKCWAHLLRKAIKLTLEDPENAEYRAFTDDLLEIYQRAQRLQSDGRLSDAGRAERVAELVEQVCGMCALVRLKTKPRRGTLDYDHRLLALELQRLARRNQLFTFVTAPPVTQPNGVEQPIGGTNNEAERTLRDPAQARKTGRTSKTPAGTRRTSILRTVLESLRLYVPQYTLRNIVEEINRWRQAGRSCFRALLDQLQIPLPSQSVLDRVIPVNSS